MISALSYDGQHEAAAKEALMKVTKKVHLQEIGKIAALGSLNTIASVATAATG